MEGEIIPYVVSKGMVFISSFAAENDPAVYIWLLRFEEEPDRAGLYDAVYESERWKSGLSPKIGALLVREESIIHRLTPKRISPLQ
ncbi:hypothetical protein [Roseovarius sp. 2305UL8-3]|uniref:hypothetical protein n=1 Tax=Roseovarius conchicola TaxID=3121636 RepID=UPI003526E8FB